jgi:hypothetical protein
VSRRSSENYQSAYLGDGSDKMVQIICNIHQTAELCQRKFSAKSRPARRLIYLTIGGLFRPDHREKPGRIELIDASIQMVNKEWRP